MTRHYAVPGCSGRLHQVVLLLQYSERGFVSNPLLSSMFSHANKYEAWVMSLILLFRSSNLLFCPKPLIRSKIRLERLGDPIKDLCAVRLLTASDTPGVNPLLLSPPGGAKYSECSDDRSE